jgi:hypothetical protein
MKLAKQKEPFFFEPFAALLSCFSLAPTKFPELPSLLAAR